MLQTVTQLRLVYLHFCLLLLLVHASKKHCEPVVSLPNVDAKYFSGCMGTVPHPSGSAGRKRELRCCMNGLFNIQATLVEHNHP